MAKKNKGRIRNVLDPFSPKQIRRETNARVRLQYGEAGRALRGDVRASRQQSRNINSWYGQYQRDMRALRAGQESALSAGQDRLRQDAAFLGGQAADRNTAVGADQDRSAAIRGAVADPSQNATESAAERQRQALMASMRTRTDQIGQASNARLSGVNAAAELGRQADQRQERNYRVERRAKMGELARDKGAARITNRNEIIRGERDYDIARRTLNSNIRNDRDRLALDRQTENRIASGGGSGGSGGSGGGKGGAGGYKGGEIRAGMGQGRKTLGDLGISAKDPRAIRQNKQGVIDVMTTPPNAIDTRLAQIVYRRLLKRAKRWDSNPNNIGSSAWNDKRPR